MTAVALDIAEEQELRDIAAQLIELTTAERAERERWAGQMPSDSEARLTRIAETKRQLRTRQRELQEQMTAGNVREQSTSREILVLNQRLSTVEDGVESVEKKVDQVREEIESIRHEVHRLARVLLWVVVGLGLPMILLFAADIYLRSR